jgi:D-ribose pyranose/furanose isomerase RbsD
LKKKKSPGVEVETLPHDELKMKSRKVKAVIRVSGAGDRWYLEKQTN